MAPEFPAGLTATSHGLGWSAAAFFQHGGSTENTVITERKCGPHRRGLHHVAAEAIHQTRRIEIQQQTNVDAAHANGRVNPRVKRPTGTSPVAGSSGARPTGHLGPVTEVHLMDWQWFRQQHNVLSANTVFSALSPC